MKYTKITLNGFLYGPTWESSWRSSDVCFRQVTCDVKRERNRICTPDGRKANLESVISMFICENGGDFVNCLLSSDSYIKVTNIVCFGDTVKQTSRSFPVTFFPSIKDWVGDREIFDLQFADEDA